MFDKKPYPTREEMLDTIARIYLERTDLEELQEIAYDIYYKDIDGYNDDELLEHYLEETDQI